MLGRKRYRTELLKLIETEPLQTLLHVYLDYWITDRIIPIAIRIYDPEQNKLYAYIYHNIGIDLNTIKEYYKGKHKYPYWVAFVDKDWCEFDINMVVHFEKYDVTWLGNAFDVKNMLEDNPIHLYVITNHTDLVAKYYKCNIEKVHYIKSEDAYKVDFLREVEKYLVQFDATTMNNMNQAITSIKVKIEKVLKDHPQIYQLLEWRLLKQYFDPRL